MAAFSARVRIVGAAYRCEPYRTSTPARMPARPLDSAHVVHQPFDRVPGVGWSRRSRSGSIGIQIGGRSERYSPSELEAAAEVLEHDTDVAVFDEIRVVVEIRVQVRPCESRRSPVGSAARSVNGPAVRPRPSAHEILSVGRRAPSRRRGSWPPASARIRWMSMSVTGRCGKVASGGAGLIPGFAVLYKRQHPARPTRGMVSAPDQVRRRSHGFRPFSVQAALGANVPAHCTVDLTKM